MAAGIITQSMEGHWSISPKFLPVIVVYFQFITPQRQWGNEAGECRQLSLVSDQYHALYIVTHTELYGGYLMLLLQDFKTYLVQTRNFSILIGNLLIHLLILKQRPKVQNEVKLRGN